MLKRVTKRILRSHFPSVFYAASYVRAYAHVSARYEQKAAERRIAFRSEANQAGKKCLQIGIKEKVGKKFGPNWVVVDKYDNRDFVDYHDDVQSMHFADSTFDAIACSAVLEHVERPWLAIEEFRRVLKPGGAIWISLPMMYPYHESPVDYWRATPDALRVWMTNFDEIGCGVSYWTKSKLVATTYYYGTKPAT